MHNEAVLWLTEELDKPRELDKTGVITHHLPTYQLIREDFYTDNLDYLNRKADVRCCGHSHKVK